MWSLAGLLCLVLAGLQVDGLPSYSKEPSYLKNLRSQTTVTKTPCHCSREACTCCGHITQFAISFEEKTCGSVRLANLKNGYLGYEFTVNERMVNATEAPVDRDPPMLCVPASILTICTSFSQVEFENGRFRFCFRLDVKFSKFTLLSVDFDCVTVALIPGFTSGKYTEKFVNYQKI